MINENLRKALIEAQKREMSEMPNEDMLANEHIYSPEFEQKMQELINGRKKYFYFAGFYIKKAVAILAIVIFSMTAALSVEAVRTPITKIIIDIYENFSKVYFDREDNGQNDSMNLYYEPIDIPFGYELIEEYEYINMSEITYSNGIDDITFKQYLLTNTQLTIDTEGIKTENILIKDIEGLTYINKGVTVVIWSDYQYGFSLMGKADKSILKEMAESIKIKK